MKRATFYLITVVVGVMLFSVSAGVASAKCLEAQVPNPADFSLPGVSTYFPQAVGTTYIYWAETEDELIRDEITITFDTKVILGVTCTVVYDVEWVSPDEGLNWYKTEETYDWYAWDNDGNVWYFGEDTVEYSFDEYWNPAGSSNEGSWEAGVDGALPGIVMPADPMTGMCYQQEYYEGEAEDMGKVLRLDVDVSIDLNDYEGCLKTKEWTPLDPGTVEHKYYAPGVGLVYIEELKEKTVKVELIEIL